MVLMTIALFFISSTERNPIRVLRLLVVLGMIITSWWLWELIYRSRRSVWGIINSRKRNIFKFLLAVFLAIFLVLGRYNTYENPRNGLPNQRVTFSEMKGMEWYTTHRVPDTLTAAILPDYTSRFDDFYWGMQGIRDNWPQYWYRDIWLPSGIYQPDWKCINQIAPSINTYLILSENGKIASLRFPSQIRDRAHNYSDSDWVRLEQDWSVNKIYDNGAFEVWITNGSLLNCE